ncbi:MAG: tyrosine-type recombinase/integrase [Acidobacteriia bacterium]|nr:tyrosine-type recombinase/integrase [Terriglobia bacterium]
MPRKQKQYANRVKILKYVKVGEAWRFANVTERSGRIVRDHVVIAGRDEQHTEGTYYLEWYELDNRRRRKAVPNFSELIEEARRKSIEVEAMRAGVIAPPANVAPGVSTARMRVTTAIDTYLDYVKHNRADRTYLTYRYTLDVLLRQSCATLFVENISREDILKFITDCYKRGLGGRTVYDKLVVVLQMFKRYGRTKLIEKNDWPDYVEKIRPIYEPEEIQTLLGNADADEAIFLKFLLGSGFRDREAQHVTWRDLDFHNSVVRVIEKPIWGFKPKNWEERAVPLPTALIDQLRTLRERRKALPAQLVFPNSKGNPDSENDMIVKRVAERAKLNCGQCLTRHGNRCSEGPHCGHFFLHKFRHTFATEHLRHGVDIRTLQSWMGHRDIKSTMVYLKGVQSKDALAKVNAGALAAYIV